MAERLPVAPLLIAGEVVSIDTKRKYVDGVGYTDEVEKLIVLVHAGTRRHSGFHKVSVKAEDFPTFGTVESNDVVCWWVAPAAYSGRPADAQGRNALDGGMSTRWLGEVTPDDLAVLNVPSPAKVKA